ncbi:MAG: protein kinase [Candidatus Moeniiplasma glomeromycotorum]|nr:protein kinase [Candidatus Moeniiplasma glomeromycotorum]MCE8167586.1 protein kinase [Candidatus Moeniiplasma glomeromycotorum]MCE8169062.1 protein kinase [Candidatus Moeniiplasma glomeromycotorum]
MANAQEWLDQNYPKEERKSKTELKINKKELKGSLKLENFTKLEELWCKSNQLTSLDVSMCPKIKKIYCAKNQLINLNLDECFELEWLNCTNNQLIEINTSNLKKLVGLHCGKNKITKLDTINLINLKEFSFDDSLTESGINNFKNRPQTLIRYSSKSTSSKVPRVHEQIARDWTSIHKGFAEKSHSNSSLESKTYQQEWEELGLNYNQTKNWINVGLNVTDASYAQWLRIVKYDLHYDNQKARAEYQEWLSNHGHDEELRAEYQEYRKWVNVHRGFAEHVGNTYKNHWKNLGFSLLETKSWIESGLEPKDHELVTKIIAYSKLKGHDLSQIKWEKLKGEYKKWESSNKPVQEYLYVTCPKEKREQLKKLNIEKKNLTDGLDLSDFKNLEELNCSKNNLTNCYFLNTLPHPEKITYLNLGNNKISQNLVVFGRFGNLKYLDLCNNPFFGSLEPLNKLEKIKSLDISDTDLNNGVEYLPESLGGTYDFLGEDEKNIFYNLNQRPNSKIKEIKEKLDTFTNKNYPKWRELGFSFEEILQWISNGLKSNEYNFADYLQEKEYQLTTPDIQQIVQQESWRDVHPNFTLEERRRWEKQEFNKEETKEWIQAGLEPKDYKFVSWLKNVKSLSSQWIINNRDEKNYQDLRKRCKDFSLCHQCQQPNTSPNQCRPCQEQEWEQDIKKLTRKEFIGKFFVWIPYEQFNKIEHLADGGFSKVYKAMWKKESVILKILNNSQNMTSEFLREVANHWLLNSESLDPDDERGQSIVECHGVSQDPITKDYIIVMDYISGGNLRQFLQKNNDLYFNFRLYQIVSIAQGLNSVHEKGLVHCDFHSGNILNNKRWRGMSARGTPPTHCYITDLGFCRPVGEKEKGNIYGVLPYVAPEVLRGQIYTQASDIYSFGIVTYEILANSYPYIEYRHLDDSELIIRVCFQNLRPNVDELKIPQLLKGLIKKCWDADPKRRPSAEELDKITSDWWKEINYHQNTEFTQQVEETESGYKNSPYRIHPKTITTSRLIDTRKITELVSSRMSSLDLSNTFLTYNNYHSTELDFDIETGVKKDDYQTQELELDINIEPTNSMESLVDRTKRQLSLETQTKTNQGDSKSVRLKEPVEEPKQMEIDDLQSHQEIPPK